MAVTREPEFGTVRMREGYDLDDVDDFVDLVIDTLEGRGAKRVTPEQIEQYEFRVVRMKTSYDMEDVDRWLDEAAAELRARAKTYQTNSPSTEPTPVAAVDDNGRTNAVHRSGSPEPSALARSGGVPVAPASFERPTGSEEPNGAATAYWPPPRPRVSAHDTSSSPPIANSLESPEPPTGPAQQTAAPFAYEPYVPPVYPEAQQIQPTYIEPLHTEPTYSAPAYTPPAYTQPAYAEPVPAEQGYPVATQPTVPSERQAARPVALIHHVELWVRDFDSAVASFGWLFKNVGWRIGRAWDRGCAWTSTGGPYIVIESGPDLLWMPYDRRGPGLNHLAFEVPDRSLVDRIASEGPSHGWQLMFADRHPYAGGPDHYAAYLENAEGFEVEIIAAE
jgi:DivIVA domain-containing protein